ncbi:MAG: VanZ family protein [Bacteroidales bacterium]|jgi:hypothetical protein|nr:VanZ family protein [Bacteroidales bacterium]
MNIKKLFLNYWKPALISLVIFYGSMASGENINQFSLFSFPYGDKIIHLLMYYIFTITLLASFIRAGKHTKLFQVIVSFVGVVSYGILMEVVQYFFTQTRSAEILDVLANITGCIVALLSYPKIKKYPLLKIL